MKLFKKKTETVEAVQWTGLNLSEVTEFTGNKCDVFHKPSDPDNHISESTIITVQTIEGDTLLQKYDYVIKTNENDFYVCKPFIFNYNFEPIK